MTPHPPGTSHDGANTDPHRHERRTTILNRNRPNTDALPATPGLPQR